MRKDQKARLPRKAKAAPFYLQDDRSVEWDRNTASVHQIDKSAIKTENQYFRLDTYFTKVKPIF